MNNRLYREYENFLTERAENPELLIFIGDFKPSLEGCTVINKKFYTKNNYIYLEDSYKFGAWKIEITGIDEPVTIIRVNVNQIGKIFADMFLSEFIISFFLRFKMELKGYSVIHASSVSLNKSAFLFPSHSGGGKTKTALYFMDEGFSLLGDDFVVIHKGKVMSYLSPMSIFSYNLNPIINNNLSESEKLMLKLLSYLYKLTSGQIKIVTRFNPKRIFAGRFEDEAVLKSVYFLFSKQKFCLEASNRDTIINNLIINQKLEAFPSFNYLILYSLIYPENLASSFWIKCRDNLYNNFPDDLTYNTVHIPKNYSRGEFMKLKEAVKCNQ